MDAKQFWQAISQRAIGSTVVTAHGSGGPAGLLGLSATHVCADPPTMLVSVDKRTSALNTILEARHFAINYLPDDAAALSEAFAGKTSAKGPDRFGSRRWNKLVTGAPILQGAVGAIDCELLETIERYGVVIILGRVVAACNMIEAVPLIHFRGGFVRIESLK
jgi:flavin reductase (DIM6/NTAB) family NADH-FMN oxidoreductase RutF